MINMCEYFIGNVEAPGGGGHPYTPVGVYGDRLLQRDNLPCLLFA